MSQSQFGVEEIDRKYEILQKIGEGGMGAVYKVRHRLLEEVRVIKVIRPQLRSQEQGDHQARFLREAKVATALRHPGIAQTYDFGIGENGTAFIVMEFVQGRDLAEVLGAGQPLAIGEVIDIASQCLEVLLYLHDNKFVHRDISPDNIMLARTAEGAVTIKLIDLGIAKPLEATQGLTRTGLFVGKLKFASPEQLSDTRGGQVGPQTDLYSFGLVLYELLTGEFPIVGDTESSIIAGHLLHPPRSFAETDPEGRVSEAVRAVVLKALEKAPENRFADAGEFRAALEAARPGSDGGQATVLLEARPTIAAPAAPSERTAVSGAAEPRGPLVAVRRWIEERNRWLVAALAATLAAAALAIAWPVVGPDRWLPRGGETRGAGGPEASGLPRGAAELDYGTYHALVIGNNAYQQLPRLETAVTDAEAMASLLETKYGFQVRLLTDATRYDTITALTEIADSLTPRDNLLLYYAGHGWLDPQNQSGYWQPVDAEPFNTANWISTKYEVSAVLGRLAARQVLVIADSCYSGALSEEVGPPPLAPEPGAETLESLRELLSRKSRLALTSGGLSPVLDLGDGRHSVFARAVLDVLGGNPRIVETSRVFGDIRRRVAEAANRFGVEQDPQLAPLPQAGDEGGDFFFVPLRG